MSHPSKEQNPLQTVALRDLRFYAYHGFYPEEQLLGNEFFVDVEVTLPYREPEEFEEENLNRTVNYEVLYQVVKEEMDVPRKLLETACYDIFERLKLNFSFVETIDVLIRKTNPPFGGDQANAEVKVSWKK